MNHLRDERMPLGSVLSLLFGGADGLGRATVFEILRNKRRRYAFHYLRQQEGPVPLAALSEQVAAWENDTDVAALDPDARQRVYVSLLQTHLPKMDEANIVDFDKSEAVVELSRNASDIEVYVEIVPDDDILWAQHYLGTTAIGAVFLVFVWLEIPPFATFVELVWLAVLAVFGVSALLHHRYLRDRRLGSRRDPV